MGIEIVVVLPELEKVVLGGIVLMMGGCICILAVRAWRNVAVVDEVVGGSEEWW